MDYAIILLIAIAAGGLGLIIGYVVRNTKGKRDAANAETKATEIVKHAEEKQNDVLQKAKEKAIKIIEDARLEEKQAMEELKKQQASLTESERAFAKKLLEIDEQRAKTERDQTALGEQQRRLDQLLTDELKKLEEIAGLTRESAMKRRKAASG